MTALDVAEFLAIRVREMTEAQLQTQVIQMARFHGFTLAYHTWDSRKSASGFPDLVMVSTRQQRVLFRELKKQSGTVSPEQQTWIDALTAAGQDACVWRPRDLFSGAIEASLKGRPV